MRDGTLRVVILMAPAFTSPLSARNLEVPISSRCFGWTTLNDGERDEGGLGMPRHGYSF